MPPRAIPSATCELRRSGRPGAGRMIAFAAPGRRTRRQSASQCHVSDRAVRSRRPIAFESGGIGTRAVASATRRSRATAPGGSPVESILHRLVARPIVAIKQCLAGGRHRTRPCLVPTRKRGGYIAGATEKCLLRWKMPEAVRTSGLKRRAPRPSPPLRTAREPVRRARASSRCGHRWPRGSTARLGARLPGCDGARKVGHPGAPARRSLLVNDHVTRCSAAARAVRRTAG
jgi:hypothetical protein